MDIKSVLFAFFGGTLLLLLGIAAYRESNPEWHEYQRTYNEMLAKKLNRPELADMKLEIKQIWNQELNRPDRCMTCHTGAENPLFADAPQPYTSHPNLDGYMKAHPFNKYGCTICHEGNSQALRVEATHGYVKHLDWQPLSGPYVEASCTKCHTNIYESGLEFPSMPRLMHGKKLVQEKACGVCHTIRQHNAIGTLAPDLSTWGSGTELAFYLLHDYHHVEGGMTDLHRTSKLNWEWEHFKNPLKVAPGNPEFNVPPTIMPNFGLTDEETTALTVYMASFKDPKIENIPMQYLPKQPLVGVPAKEVTVLGK
jgi:cytochrome c2